MNDTITGVPGIEVGHAQDEEALTGCTVVLCRGGAVAGVDQRGGAPGTRETDLLRPLHRVQRIHAVMLAGGSAYGLDAAGGAMHWLEEADIGFDVGVAKVPIVPAAILFDLDMGRADVRPDVAMGEAACRAASSELAAQGCVGVGTGAAVGRIFGVQFATKSGIGTSSIDLGGGLVVGVLVAVNTFGDVVDEDGRILAGARTPPEGERFANVLKVFRSEAGRQMLRFAQGGGNTAIGVVATSARLTKNQANKVAQMAHDGLARAVRPAHTLFDGDTLFTMATGEIADVDVNLVGAFAAEVTAQAIRNAVRTAEPAGGLPAAGSIQPEP